MCPVLMLDSHFIVYDDITGGGVYIADRQGPGCMDFMVRVKIGFSIFPTKLFFYMYTN